MIRTALLLCGTLLSSPVPAFAQPPVNEHSAILKDFDDRVQAYVKLQKAAQEGLQSSKAASKKGDMLSHQQQLAERIRAMRETAKQGDMCTPEIAGELRRLIAMAMDGNAPRVRGSLRSGEPVRLPLRVNAAFPEKLPLQTSPPTLLMNLPRLPQELDYRFVGNAVVLRDAVANIIVDFVPNALPASK